MKKFIKPAALLSVIILISILTLIFVNKLTYPYINKRETAWQNKIIAQVLPGFTINEELITDLDKNGKFSYYTGTKNVDGFERKGYAFITVVYGFGSDIKIITGVDEEYRILGISIMQQPVEYGFDTPGQHKEVIPGIITLKGFSREAVTGLWFQQQFTGIDLNKPVGIIRNDLIQKESKEDMVNRNVIIAVPGTSETVKAITDGLRYSVIILKKARQMREQNMMPETVKEESE